MSNCHRYEAFGLVIQSEYPIAQLSPAEQAAAVDVTICQADLTAYGVPEGCYRLYEQELMLSIAGVAAFRITNGALVEIQPHPDCTPSHLGVYIMGTCMGAVLHQRGYLPLHGSCVTDGTHSVLITGDSGAGKSTLAAEFISRGWKLLTDDVCAVTDPTGVPTVHASYPSQKLWQDSLTRYGRSEDEIHSLYFSEEREKFGVDVSPYFWRGTAPLSMVVRLLPTDEPCSIVDMNMFQALDQLQENTYRSFMIHRENWQRHFQRCAAMAEKLPVVLLTRQIGVQCAHTLFELITDRLEKEKDG